MTMQFIYLITAFFFLFAFTNIALAFNLIADLCLVYEILLDKCLIAFFKVLKALENLLVNASITATPSYTSLLIITSALTIKASLTRTLKI
jgi:hypothetical protein